MLEAIDACRPRVRAGPTELTSGFDDLVVPGGVPRRVGEPRPDGFDLSVARAIHDKLLSRNDDLEQATGGRPGDAGVDRRHGRGVLEARGARPGLAVRIPPPALDPPRVGRKGRALGLGGGAEALGLGGGADDLRGAVAAVQRGSHRRRGVRGPMAPGGCRARAGGVDPGTPCGGASTRTRPVYRSRGRGAERRPGGSLWGVGQSAVHASTAADRPASGRLGSSPGHGRRRLHRLRRGPGRLSGARPSPSVRSPRWPTSAWAAAGRFATRFDPRLRPLARSSTTLVFGGWDDLANALREARTAGVLEERPGPPCRASSGDALPCRRCSTNAGSNASTACGSRPEVKWDLASRLIADIERFRTENELDRLAMVWCGPPRPPGAVSVHRVGRGVRGGCADDENISPSRLPAYAALGVPFGTGAPNPSTDLPCMELAAATACRSPENFKTGQTTDEDDPGAGVQAQMLGLRGWYSTNILGNRDGEVLDDPEKLQDQGGLQAGRARHDPPARGLPHLYGNIDHVVASTTTPARRQQGGWDNIDIFGWMGYPMQIKVDFLCRDSIPAAVVSTSRCSSTWRTAPGSGVQEWLSFYWKSPQPAPGGVSQHDIFIQQTKLKNTLREWMENRGHSLRGGMIVQVTRRTRFRSAPIVSGPTRPESPSWS